MPTDNQYNFNKQGSGFSAEEMSVLEIFEYHCRAKNLSPFTTRSYRQSVEILGECARLADKEIKQLDKADIQRLLLSKLNNGWNGSTANHRLRDWSVFFGFLLSEGIINYNPVRLIPKCKEEQKVQQIIEPAEFSKILKSFSRIHRNGARNQMFLLLMWECMLRLGETINVKLSDINMEHRIIRIHGKGSKQRELIFGYKTATKLMVYLETYRKNIPGQYLFPTRRGTRLSEVYMWKTIKAAGLRCGIKINPHLIRHSSATIFQREVGDIYMTQKILGHAKTSTTQIYLHDTVADIKRIYDTRFSPAVSLNF